MKVYNLINSTEIFMTYISRHLETSITRAMGRHTVVLLNGARQVGKSTLALRWGKEHQATYCTLDTPGHVAAALDAPYEFLHAQPKPLILNEIQQAPSLFRALKRYVDERRAQHPHDQKGKVLLTGSANLMILPKLADAMVGRMGIETLYPLSAPEALGIPGPFLDELWNNAFATRKPICSLLEAMEQATYPELSTLEKDDRPPWLNAYLTTLLQRDIRSLAQIEQFEKLPQLLHIVANRSGGLINDAAIARDAGLNANTCKNYRQLLKAIFLTFDIQPWYRNLNKRFVKSPKSYFLDTLLLDHLLNWQHRNILLGHLVENFVASELTKQLAYHPSRAKLYHYRTQSQQEIDFILERPDGTLAAIEVKASEHVDAQDFKTIKTLQQECPNDFQCGIVLYRGQDIIPFGTKRWAIPLSQLYS